MKVKLETLTVGARFKNDLGEEFYLREEPTNNTEQTYLETEKVEGNREFRTHMLRNAVVTLVEE